MDILIFVILGLLAYFSFYFVRLVYGDFFAPIGLCLGINLVSISLYHLSLMVMLTSISVYTYIIIFLSLFSFLVGALMFSPRLVLQGAVLDRHALFQEAKKETKGLAVFYYGTGILSIGGWISLVFFVKVLANICLDICLKALRRMLCFINERILPRYVHKVYTPFS